MIYADNAATTAVHQSVLAAMIPLFAQNGYANPSSQHAAGREARTVEDSARKTVADGLGCSPREVIFTASGSEADNQALRTAAAWGRKRGRMHIVSSAFEHPAILRTLEALASEGFETTLVSPTPEGIIEPEAVRQAVRPRQTCLVSVMTVNNEIGTIQPIPQIAAVAHEAGALCHTDAVQAVGHVPVNMVDMGVDMLSLSAHKFHGPKGIGALLCRETAFGEALSVVPLVLGGGQERGRRAGTENVPGIAGLAEALAESLDHLDENARCTQALRDRLIEGLCAIEGSHLMGDRTRRNPGTVNVCFEGVNREALLALLDERGICASAGSACESGAVSISPVLRAMGVPAEIAAGALRLSICEDNTAEEVEQIIAAVSECVASVRRADAEFRADAEER
jgi:cysteine desulfurase